MSGLRFSIREILLLTLIVALLLTWGMQTYLRQWPTAREKALMQERLESLKEEVAMQEQMMATGIIDSSKALRDAQVEALAAELELCSTRSERIDVLKRNLEAQQKYEKLALARFKTGSYPANEMLRAKANRLKGEIALGGPKPDGES